MKFDIESALVEKGYVYDFENGESRTYKNGQIYFKVSINGLDSISKMEINAISTSDSKQLYKGKTPQTQKGFILLFEKLNLS